MRFSPDGERLRRRLPALPGRSRSSTAGCKEGSPTTPTVADDAAAQAARLLATLLGTARRAGRAGRRRADPAPALRAGAGDGRGGRPLQRERVPAHGRRDRQEPRRAEGVDRAALGRRTPRSSSRSRGTSPGTSTASPRTRPSRCGWTERGHDPEELEATFTELERAARRRRPDRPGHRAASSARTGRRRSLRSETVIYCVIPRELEDELFEKMVEYYKDNPNVTVIVDRRDGPDRRDGHGDVGGEAARSATAAGARAPGTFPDDRRRSRTRLGAVASTAPRPSRTSSAASGSTPPAARPSRRSSPATGEMIGVVPALERRGRRPRGRRREGGVRGAGGSCPAPERGKILFRFAQLLARAQGRARRADDARDGQGAAPRPAATSRKRST